jgi:hypothetical protein
MHKWSLINRALDMGIPEPTETYSSSPHLYVDLDIPEGTKGRLKTAGPPRVREAAPSSAGRDGARGAGDRGRGGQRSSERPPRERQVTAEGGGTHDGAAPRRRRNRTRRPSTGSQPPAA